MFECISEYFYWNKLIRMDKKIARMRAKWNDVSRQCYELEQDLHLECCRNNSCQKKNCVHYPMLQKYKKAMDKSKKFKNKMEMLRTKQQRIKSR